MSPPTTVNRDPAEYLASVLPLNPIFQAEEILAARNRFLGRKESATESETWQLQEQRETLHAQINTLRERFWTSPPNELREALEGLAVEPFPDLKLASDRLWAALRVRSEFPKLSQHPKCDHELFEKLKEVAVTAPRDAGRTKQAFFLRTSGNLKLHRRCCAMIKALRKEYPDLFQLEQEWLQQIEQSKPIAGMTESEKEAAERSKDASGGRVGWIVAFVLLSGLGRAFLHSDRSSTSTPPRTAPIWNAPVAPPQQSQTPIGTTPNGSSGNPTPRKNPMTFEEAVEMHKKWREQREQLRNRPPTTNPQEADPFRPKSPREAESR